MPNSEQESLVQAAISAREYACAPYSKFHVGAALLTAKGAKIAGANVESASYGLTCCAERIALFKALTDGHNNFIAIAVVAAVPNGPMPCGACRQLLWEYAPAAVIWVTDVQHPEVVREFTTRELLPSPFMF